MTLTYSRPDDQESWTDWMARRTREEQRTACYAFYIDDELVCTRESVRQAAADFAELCRRPDGTIRVVQEKKDGTTLTLALRLCGAAIAGSPWFLRAAGL